MAFAYTTTNEVSLGGRRLLYGTYTSSGGGTGGDITPGTSSTATSPMFQSLSKIESVTLTLKAAAVANAHVVNTVLPASATKFTIVTGANEVGFWQAIGY